jgi:phosphoenolpyruvate carboxylase
VGIASGGVTPRVLRRSVRRTVGISDFSLRHGVTRAVLEAAILRLDIESALQVLAEIFAPMRRLFGLVREIATAITHEVGAFR